MSQDSNNTRVVAIVNKRIEPGVAMNAILHLGAGIVNLMGDDGRQRLQFIDFKDADGKVHRSISARSFIVLRANSSQIRKVYERGKEIGLPSVAFTNTMTGDTYREQLERTELASSDSLDFYGIAIIGERDVVGPMTRKFSLWR